MFGAQAVRTISVARAASVTKGGSGLMQVGTPTADAASYVLSSTCGQPLAAGSSCAASVSFVPRPAGVRQATLQMPSDGEPSPPVGHGAAGHRCHAEHRAHSPSGCDTRRPVDQCVRGDEP